MFQRGDIVQLLDGDLVMVLSVEEVASDDKWDKCWVLDSLGACWPRVLFLADGAQAPDKVISRREDLVPREPEAGAADKLSSIAAGRPGC
jgi:hypothetical protein